MAIYREQLNFLKRISSRTSSAVYLCQERESKDLVVLKQTLLTRSMTSEQNHGDDPWQEHDVARLLFSLGGHPHLLNYRSAHVEDNSIFLLMDFCEQGDLYSYLEGHEERKLDEPLARHFFRQILLGVQFLHQHGVAHRDISLENVLLDDKFIVKLCDFGLSTSFKVAKTGDGGNGKTRVVGRVGKAYYMAPEVVADTEYNPIQADIWSLGILLFIMLTGSPLFEAASPEDPAFIAVQRVGVRGVLKHWKLDDEISSGMIDLLSTMLQCDPALRFQSVDEILDAMRDADQQGSIITC
ncbi:Camk protein kinase [Globisporangium polare]